jgi:SAM-dependent methyltransferase
MSSKPTENEAEFDQFAADYDAELNKGLSLTGESKEYFAEGRMRWVRQRLGALGFKVSSALDFGCGTGSSTPYFFDILGAARLTGIDPSEDSLKVARENWPDREATFLPTAGFAAPGSVDLAFCNGVFHHIPPDQREAAVGFVFEALRPGGLFAFWENNAWNPATRFVMSRVPFDRDAILLFPHQARRLLRGAGFEVLGTDYLFVFPGPLAALRPLEPGLCKLPLGGQYLVLVRKPEP